MASHIFRNLDGPLFRQQRELLLRLATEANTSNPVMLTERDRDLLEGLINLTDVIADEAHDRFGVNCLLTYRKSC